MVSHSSVAKRESVVQSNTILIVDDEEFQRELIAMQLINLGWINVLTAANGQQALQIFDQQPLAIRLVISDLSMPDMDGLVLMRHLAQRGYGGAILLLSGMQDEILSSAGGLAHAHGLHMLGYLSKPCEPEQLRDKLNSLQNSGAGRSNFKLEEALAPERLSAALAAGEFIPWYQPKIDLRDDTAVGAEALARWPQADGSMISPGAFIPAIEAAGLADALFFALTRQIVDDVVRWRAHNLNIKTAINMSMDSALNLSLPERLGQIVAEAGLRPADFVIEVTESRLMVERSIAMETLTRLSLMGFTLSIDDFGTGYSSLVQLIDLPFKELKIDGSFVQRSSTEQKAQSILSIAVMLGTNLRMGVVAEGVEKIEQLEFLRNCGGHIVQGYYFARPMPFAQCTAWLQARMN